MNIKKKIKMQNKRPPRFPAEVFIFGYHRILCTQEDIDFMKLVQKKLDKTQFILSLNPLERDNLIRIPENFLYRLREEGVTRQLEGCKKICLLPNFINNDTMIEEVFSLKEKGYKITYFKSNNTIQKLFPMLLKMVSEESKLKEVEILQHSRKPEIIVAKNCITILLKIFTGAPTGKLGELFGQKQALVTYHIAAYFNRSADRQKETEKIIKNIGRKLFADLLIE